MPAILPTPVGEIASETVAPFVGDYPEDLKAAILRREGGKQFSVSSKGAIGPGQIMPATGMKYVLPEGNPKDPTDLAKVRNSLFDLDINSYVMDAHLSDLWNKYHDRQAVMVAYNAGEGKADEWLKKGRDPSVLAEETRKYIGIGSSAKPGAPGWIPSDRAIEAEQNRENVDVKWISPEEYLARLPELDEKEAPAKKNNLLDSLHRGEFIESLPSLEVEPKGDRLKIVDFDGRNRAQAAIDAGLDEIPVAIRGVPKGGTFNGLIGTDKETVPYRFNSVVPISRGPLPIGPASPQATPTAIPPAPPSMVPTPTKPDFYPQIAAGLNKSLLNPASEGFRGVMPTNPATTITGPNRIAAANANSAGQIGLIPQVPVSVPPSASSGLGGIFSALNPIGSASAAELPVSVGEIGGPAFPAPAGDIGSAPSGLPTPVGEITLPPRPESWIPDPPLLNSLLAKPMATAIGDVGALFNSPSSFPDWTKKSQTITNKLLSPETAVGDMIAGVMGTPALLAKGVLEYIVGGGDYSVGKKKLDAAYPYAKPFLDLLPFLGGVPGVGNVLSAPGRAILSKAIQSPEMRAANAINKVYPQELAVNKNVALANMGPELGRAQAAGIPLTIADYSVRRGPMEQLLGESLRAAPEALGEARDFAEKRARGTPDPLDFTAEPSGGALERMSSEAKAAFGSKNAHDRTKEISKEISDRAELLENYQKQLAAAKIAGIKNPSPMNKKIFDNLTAGVDALAKANAKDDAIAKRNLAGIKLGQGILRNTVREEEIRDFLKSANWDNKNHLRLGVSDALRRAYRQARVLGEEPAKVVAPIEVRNKISRAFDNSRTAASDFIDGLNMEDRIRTSALNDLRPKSENATFYTKRLPLMELESLGHIALGHSFSPHYWTVKLARQLAEGLSTKGGSTIKAPTARSIVDALTNPNVLVGKDQLIPVPPRPPEMQQRLNALSAMSPYFGRILFDNPQFNAPSQ